MHSNRKWFFGIAALLVLCAVAAFMVSRPRQTGAEVAISYDGEVVGTFDLYENRTIVLHSGDGSWQNTLQIQDGTASIIDANCENQICVQMPPLQENQPGLITCLPHRLVISLQEAS